jgi:hypothetical protein
VFDDDATFQVCGHMWERNNLQALMIEGTTDSPKFNDFGAVSKQKELGLSLFFFFF